MGNPRNEAPHARPSDGARARDDRLSGRDPLDRRAPRVDPRTRYRPGGSRSRSGTRAGDRRSGPRTRARFDAHATPGAVAGGRTGGPAAVDPGHVLRRELVSIPTPGVASGAPADDAHGLRLNREFVAHSQDGPVR